LRVQVERAVLARDQVRARAFRIKREFIGAGRVSIVAVVLAPGAVSAASRWRSALMTGSTDI
jgi:hypothetical protein